MLVVPVAAAGQVSRSFTESLLVAVVLAQLSVLLGIGVAFYGEATAGGVIVLVAVAVYVATVALGKVGLGRRSTPVGTADEPDRDPADTPSD
jgi:zinc transport system permease protein